jgi:hypothetical protein
MAKNRVFGGKTIVEEPEVLNAIARYRKTIHRFQDAYDALIWNLSHEGEGIRGECIRLGGEIHYLYVQKADKIAGTPRLRAVFTSNNYQVTIVQLQVVPSK